MAGSKERLLALELIESAFNAYREAAHAEATAATRRRTAAERKLARTKAQLDWALELQLDGEGDPDLKAGYQDHKAKKASLEAELAAVPDTKVELHPNAAALYRRQVEALEELLDDPDTRAFAHDAAKALIEAVIVGP